MFSGYITTCVKQVSSVGRVSAGLEPNTGISFQNLGMCHIAVYSGAQPAFARSCRIPLVTLCCLCVKSSFCAKLTNIYSCHSTLTSRDGLGTPKQGGLPHRLCLSVAKQGQVGSCQLETGNLMGRFLELGGGENIDLALCVCN